MKRALLWLIRFYRSAISPRKPAMWGRWRCGKTG